MENNGNESIRRLKRVLLYDKETLPRGFYEVLEGELKLVLDSYFDYAPDNCKIDLGLTTNGEYFLKIDLKANQIKSAKLI